MSSSSANEIVHQGWLTKSPPTKAIFRPRWRRRWFILKSGSYPNQFVLEYFTDESCRRQKGSINLDECETIVGPLKVQIGVQDRSRFTFHLRTPSRTYYLAADSEEEMAKWVEGLCHVLGLKIMEDDGDGNTVYAKPSNENNKPNEAPPESHNNENEESSPTPSNKSPSGPYIPISECFTGKPIIFNPPNGNEEVTYYNASSFPFPPKVNWATHPYMKESSKDDDGRSPKGNDASFAPPRPPKKNSSKPTTPTTTSVTAAVQLKSVGGSPRSPDDTQAGHSAGVYENVEENADSTSTSSSLHSPPGSAGGGGLYCNIPDTSDKAAGKLQQQQQTAQVTTVPTTPTSDNSQSAIPPKVDRNLKPEVKKANEINAAMKSHSTSSSSNGQSQSRQGCMTLPNKSSQSNFYPIGGYHQGPEIDRTRKPSDGHFPLSSTPAQLKQSAMQNNSRTNTPQNSRMNTLPNSTRRREGPLISPHDKKPHIFHEYETAQEVHYMQIDCQAITKDSETRSQTLKLPSKKPGLGGLPPEGSVEYRLIDHVKTKALNQMRIDREKQLQTNTTRH